jgi:hypothetical protein
MWDQPVSPEITIKQLRKNVETLQNSVFRLIEKLNKEIETNISLREKLIDKVPQNGLHVVNDLYECPYEGCLNTVQGGNDICFYHLKQYLTGLELYTKSKDWSVENGK